ncbi:DHH family phosphoesterase [Aureimonas jatrophae]|uniref:Single-stranded-DNA-specific exonuclease n=1 Tax=Aureimonas jatrophae TaxID=1166073 RepID=A0A1H0EQE6_9HYPH|nr:DHH family phosphoesterase [Aureimonas jatrophae]MBB3950373.1 single-stranded-DNA-specific exonuclease [Aureimonas jatrophae]SDN84529.1 single-stranded-DNA-specific exonuclease [Aureimonas jatrophae]
MSIFSGLQPPEAFAEAALALGPAPLVACHNDADGLSAGAILVKTLQRLGTEPSTRIVGKGENAYSDAFLDELRGRAMTGLVVTDLGVSSRLPDLGLPTVLIDHHVPTGVPTHACVVSGIEDDPIPTSSLLAYRCAKAIGVETGDLLWLAAIGLIGDMADEDGFPEMEEARALGITALRKAVSLVNAPRRTASGDASAALGLLLKADGAKAVLSGAHAETAALLQAKEEVKAALDAARKIGPKVSAEVALIPFSSPCQIHPLVAQAWRTRIRDRIVIAANFGYREGWVHFAARTGEDRDLIAFLAEHRPPGAGEEYGNGHRLASGGALRLADWNHFVHAIGFGPELEAAA